jgi:hypothetical protein
VGSRSTELTGETHVIRSGRNAPDNESALFCEPVAGICDSIAA